MVYLDMNKRNNIIVGTDGKPYLIDFQISLYFDPKPWLFKSIKKHLQNAFQNADLYHLFKHKRRLSPETLRPEEERISRPNSLIEIHRCIANPYRRIRRKLLDYMRHKGLIHPEDTPDMH
ncbi:MAG: protein kinase family protein [Planctomycetota bacterium]